MTKYAAAATGSATSRTPASPARSAAATRMPQRTLPQALGWVSTTVPGGPPATRAASSATVRSTAAIRSTTGTERSASHTVP